MSVICFCSKKDLAALNIKHQLLALFPFTETSDTYDAHPIHQLANLSVVTIEKDSIYADNLDESFSADLFIFASRHKSAAFKPALLTHIPGNWAEADLGGKASTLCIAPPSAMKIALHSLLSEQQRLGLTDWACGLEATHHGPFIPSTPVLYVEIGSTEKEWENPIAAEIVARTIVTVAQQYQTSYPTVLGFGGPHYCPGFTRLSVETPYAVSHVLPKYHLDQLSESLFAQAIQRSSPQPTHAALDWKGMKGDQRNQVKTLAEGLGLKVDRVRNLIRSSNE
ncbi:MAG: D-aminoacyl-tRNA deacylase [Candidatus Hermodarchaeia archaeon]